MAADLSVVMQSVLHSGGQVPPAAHPLIAGPDLAPLQNVGNGGPIDNRDRLVPRRGRQSGPPRREPGVPARIKLAGPVARHLA